MYELNKLYNLDCMEVMRNTPDKFFDLAIVDPPYGGAEQQDDAVLRGGGTDWQHKKRSRFGGRFDKYQIESKPRIRRSLCEISENDRGYL